MINAAVYIRVSTPGQAEDGLGLEAQREACERIATQHGLTVSPNNIIIEQASGGFIERDGLDRVRGMVRGRRIEALITYDTDRLVRDDVWQALLLREARDAGVAVFTLKGLVDTSMTGDLVNYISGWAAKLEREKIRQRTMDGKRAWAKKGVLPVGAGVGLYGYDYRPRDEANKKPQARIVNEAEAAVVRRMFDMALEGFGVNTIATILNRDGIKGKTGALWHARTVWHTLHNPAYAGKTTYGREATKLLARGKVQRTRRAEAEVITVEGFTPPIISMATFERVQAHLNRPRRSGRAFEPYLLSGLLTCAKCGTGLVGQRMNKGRYLYYVCRKTGPTATRPQECDAKRAQVKGLDRRMRAAVSRAVLDGDFLYDRIMAQRDGVRAAPGSGKEDELQGRLAALARGEKALVASLRSAPSAVESITAELEKIAGERKALEREIKALHAPAGGSGDQPITKVAVRAFTEAVAERLRTMTDEDWRQLFSLVGFEAVVGDAGDVKEASIAVPVCVENGETLHNQKQGELSTTQNGRAVQNAGVQPQHPRLNTSKSSFTTGQTWEYTIDNDVAKIPVEIALWR